MKYRAEIDGLRALAVIPVILFHAGFSIFSGGFVGVDIFFVISGFLITSLLIEDIEKGRFSLVDFYERRARRILPALFFMVVCTLFLSWLWLPSGQFKDVSKSAVAVGLFLSNVFFWQGSDYFDSASETKPLLHTWSLSVEEQFYLIFPIFLVFIWRFGRSKAFWCLFGFCIISLLLSEWGWRKYPTANFYLLPTRAWELFAGGLAAIWIHQVGRKESKPLSWFGLILILLSIFAFDEALPFPGFYTLIPVLGAVLFILFSSEKSLPAKILSSRPLVAIGLISYSAYLWHQPIFAFLRANTFEEPDKLSIFGFTLLSFLIAWFSWRFIEKPFRNRHFLNRKKVLAFSIVGLLLLIVVGVFLSKKSNDIGSGWFNSLASYGVDNKALQRNSWNILRRISGESKYSVKDNVFDRKDWFPDGSTKANRFLLVGNSHSKDLYNVMTNNMKVKENVLLTRYGVQIRNLSKKNEFWESPNYIKSSVVFFATRFGDRDVDNLEYVISRAIKDGKKVYIVKRIFDMPEYRSRTWSLIDYVNYELKESDLNDKEKANEVNRRYTNSYHEFKKDSGESEINKKINEIAIRTNVIALDKMDYVCGINQASCEAVSDLGEKFFYDYGHHTSKGAEHFGFKMDVEGWLHMSL